jgi:hypothetical protein
VVKEERKLKATSVFIVLRFHAYIDNLQMITGIFDGVTYAGKT